MTVTITPRLGAERPGAPTDPFSRAQYLTLLDSAEAKTALFSQADPRPAPGIPGRIHRHPTTGAVTWDNGTAWDDIAVSRAGGSVITAGDAAVRPLAVRGVAGQTAALFEAQNDAGAVLASVSADGQVVGSRVSSTGGLNVLGAGSATAGTTVTITGAGTNGVPLWVRGTAGQTNNLQAWANASNVTLAAIDSGGGLIAKSAEINGTIAGTQASVTANTGTLRALVVRGAGGQSANIFEARNSADGVLVAISATGKVTTQSLESGDYVNPGGSVAVGSSAAFAYGARLEVTATAATHRGLVVRGAASQTANLAEFQNSAGTVLAAVAATGAVTVTDADGQGQRILRFGAPDSAGAGFRTVRVANS